MENAMMETNAPVAMVNVARSLTGRLLAMAHQYKQEGNLRQATELYWSLVEGHANTPQAEEAKVVLLGLADEYERNNGRRMARSIYERLMRLEG